MALPGQRVRRAEGGVLTFRCPGCQDVHGVPVAELSPPGAPPMWKWNGDLGRPTLTPSLLVRSGHHATEWKAGDPCWCTYDAEHPGDPSGFACYTCHSFVSNGQIQFLGDCSHALANQTVDLPDVSEGMFP